MKIQRSIYLLNDITLQLLCIYIDLLDIIDYDLPSLAGVWPCNNMLINLFTVQNVMISVLLGYHMFIQNMSSECFFFVFFLQFSNSCYTKNLTAAKVPSKSLYVPDNHSKTNNNVIILRCLN